MHDFVIHNLRLWSLCMAMHAFCLGACFGSSLHCKSNWGTLCLLAKGAFFGSWCALCAFEVSRGIKTLSAS